MQGNAARAEDLRQRLATHGGTQPGAALAREIETGRIVAWQVKTVDWHPAEARRLREQAARTCRT
jgi:hypothetical protein